MAEWIYRAAENDANLDTTLDLITVHGFFNRPAFNVNGQFVGNVRRVEADDVIHVAFSRQHCGRVAYEGIGSLRILGDRHPDHGAWVETNAGERLPLFRVRPGSPWKSRSAGRRTPATRDTTSTPGGTSARSNRGPSTSPARCSREWGHSTRLTTHRRKTLSFRYRRPYPRRPPRPPRPARSGCRPAGPSGSIGAGRPRPGPRCGRRQSRSPRRDRKRRTLFGELPVVCEPLGDEVVVRRLDGGGRLLPATDEPVAEVEFAAVQGNVPLVLGAVAAELGGGGSWHGCNRKEAHFRGLRKSPRFQTAPRAARRLTQVVASSRLEQSGRYRI